MHSGGEKLKPKSDPAPSAGPPPPSGPEARAATVSALARIEGEKKAALPDVCKTPGGPAPVPIPYPAVATAPATTKKVEVGPSPSPAPTAGPEAGATKGIVSNQNMDKAQIAVPSNDVKVEGKNVALTTDGMIHNGSR